MPFLVAVRRLVRIGPASNPLRQSEGCTSHTILVVDDSALIRRLIRSCIERNTDWEVCGEAENGLIAIEKVAQLHPDVVILDLQMPVMNGLEAAREINRIAPASTMLMFTLYDSGQLRREAYAAGVRDVLSKSNGLTEHLIRALSNACASVKATPLSNIAAPGQTVTARTRPSLMHDRRTSEL